VIVTEVLSDFLTGRVSGWDARMAALVYRNAGRVCPDSALLEEALRIIEPRGRYEVVPNVVDVDEFSNPPRPPRAVPGRQVVAVSSLVPRKGLTQLVEAARLLVADGRDIAVAVIGEGPERAALEEQSSGLPIDFVGNQSRADLVARVRDADVFAMPSLAETFGISAVEALAGGVPVVITSACGAAPLIEANGGRVVPPADPRALCDALRELLDAPNSVPAYAASNLRAYCGRDAVAERFDAIYRSMPELSA
jgi:glycosyltransferase involved in cell wall biosynthesis